MANEKHLYVTFGGSYGIPGLAEETWQCGIRFYAAPGGGPDPVGTLSNGWDVVADTVARTETDWTIEGNWRVEGGISDLNVGDWLNDQLAPTLASWIDSVTCISSVTNLEWVKVYPIGTNGKAIPAPPYADGSPITLTWTSTPPNGSGSATVLPLQVAAVVSHRTSQVGRRGRGRMFLPGVGTNALGSGTTAGRMVAGMPATIASVHVAMLEAVQLDGTASGFWCLPAIIGSPWTDYALINQVRVGDVLDTQRRRRRSLPETFESDPVANPA